MNSQLKKIFEIVHSNNDSLIVPIGNLTIELQSCWTSKLDEKFKVEYRILELTEDNKFYNLETAPFLHSDILRNYVTKI